MEYDNTDLIYISNNLEKGDAFLSNVTLLATMRELNAVSFLDEKLRGRGFAEESG